MGTGGPAITDEHRRRLYEYPTPLSFEAELTGVENEKAAEVLKEYLGGSATVKSVYEKADRAGEALSDTGLFGESELRFLSAGYSPLDGRGLGSSVKNVALQLTAQPRRLLATLAGGPTDLTPRLGVGCQNVGNWVSATLNYDFSARVGISAKQASTPAVEGDVLRTWSREVRALEGKGGLPTEVGLVKNYLEQAEGEFCTEYTVGLRSLKNELNASQAFVRMVTVKQQLESRGSSTPFLPHKDSLPYKGFRWTVGFFGSRGNFRGMFKAEHFRPLSETWSLASNIAIRGSLESGGRKKTEVDWGTKAQWMVSDHFAPALFFRSSPGRPEKGLRGQLNGVLGGSITTSFLTAALSSRRFGPTIELWAGVPVTSNDFTQGSISSLARLPLGTVMKYGIRITNEDFLA